MFQLKVMIHQPIEEKLYLQPLFWFCLGSILFYSLNFASFGLHAVMKSDLPDFVFDLVIWLNLILYYIYFVVIYLSTRLRKNDDIIG
jgi:hypothetical protein